MKTITKFSVLLIASLIVMGLAIASTKIVPASAQPDCSVSYATSEDCNDKKVPYPPGEQGAFEDWLNGG
jgi:hypothetical protein